jgi:uncharacterized protein YyaL (SSP411 family)
MVTTLRAMARKAACTISWAADFHRYSVDERWFVPHFEKMLYDQAQLPCLIWRLSRSRTIRCSPASREARWIMCCAT